MSRLNNGIDRVYPIDYMYQQLQKKDDLLDNNLYEIYGKLDDNASQLAEKATQADVTNGLALKRDISIKLGQNDMTPEFLSQMAGNTSINSIPQDGSVTAAKIKGTFTSGKNLFNKDDVTFGSYLASATGVLTAGTSGSGLNAASGFIKVPDDGIYYHNKTANVICYDVNKTFISGLASGTPQSRDLPTGTVYVRLSFIQTDIDALQFEKGSTGTSYQGYQFDISGLKTGFDFLSSVGRTYYRYNTPVIANNTITFKAPTTIYFVKNDNTYDSLIITGSNVSFPFVHNTCIVLDTVTKTLTNTALGTAITKDQRVLFLNIDGKLVAGTLKEQYDADLLSSSNASNPVTTKSIKKFLSKTITESTVPNGMTVVGNELWTFSASNDANTDTAKCIRYSIDSSTYALTKVGEFTHNWGHVNSISYCEENDTLILGNGSGDYNLSGKIYILPNATSFKSLSNVDLNTSGIIIDVASMSWGSKTNVVWGESNDGNNNIAFVITNDNKNIRRILLGRGTTSLANGTFIAGKGATEFNGTFAVLNEYSQLSGDDVLQDAHFGSDGYLYLGLGHDGLWYARITLNADGTISKQLTRTQIYNNDGTVLSTQMESISEYNGKLFVRAVSSGAWVYVVDK